MRPSVLGLQVCCCAVKHDLVTLVVIMILKDEATFQVLFYSFSVLCLEHHYCEDQQWRSLTWKLNPSSAFVYFRWSWSCYFGLGLKNLVLFTSIAFIGGVFSITWPLEGGHTWNRCSHSPRRDIWLWNNSWKWLPQFHLCIFLTSYLWFT